MEENGIYMKYKDFYIKWITVMEEIQFKKSKLTDNIKNQIRKLLYEDFDINKNCKKQAERNLEKVLELVLNLS